jgi:hypothetical protein
MSAIASLAATCDGIGTGAITSASAAAAIGPLPTATPAPNTALLMSRLRRLTSFPRMVTLPSLPCVEDIPRRSASEMALSLLSG